MHSITVEPSGTQCAYPPPGLSSGQAHVHNGGCPSCLLHLPRLALKEAVSPAHQHGRAICALLLLVQRAARRWWVCRVQPQHAAREVPSKQRSAKGYSRRVAFVVHNLRAARWQQWGVSHTVLVLQRAWAGTHRQLADIGRRKRDVGVPRGDTAAGKHRSLCRLKRATGRRRRVLRELGALAGEPCPER